MSNPTPGGKRQHQDPKNWLESARQQELRSQRSTTTVKTPKDHSKVKFFFHTCQSIIVSSRSLLIQKLVPTQSHQRSKANGAARGVPPKPKITITNCWQTAPNGRPSGRPPHHASPTGEPHHPLNKDPDSTGYQKRHPSDTSSAPHLVTERPNQELKTHGAPVPKGRRGRRQLEGNIGLPQVRAIPTKSI